MKLDCVSGKKCCSIMTAEGITINVTKKHTIRK